VIRRTVHVIGAGVAGLSAAVRLAEAGLEVIVHEAAQAAGGRCRSFYDQALGLLIDNGNHLLLSGNHTALDYLGRIGSLDGLSGPGAALFDFADLGSGERWRLSLNEGRVPWWLLDRNRRAPGTSFREYLAPLPMLVRAPAASTVGQAMKCAGPLYERLWRPLLLAGLNTDPQEGSAALAAALMRETLGAGGRACHPLIAGRGLSRTFVDPALAYLAKRNGAIRYSDRLREIRFAGGRAVALEFETRSVRLDDDAAAVIAVPPLAARELIPGLEAPDEFRAIVNAHFRIDPPPGQPAILGVVNGFIEWLFAYPDRLSVTISNADRLIDRPRDELAAWIWREAAALSGLPPELPPWRIVKEKRATFASTPAQNARRPPSQTRWENVALAGDWIQTGLPATIEGAVRSGYKAASIFVEPGAVAPKPRAVSVSP
jgi:hydroxysqualene dehydroxylase